MTFKRTLDAGLVLGAASQIPAAFPLQAEAFKAAHRLATARSVMPSPHPSALISFVPTRGRDAAGPSHSVPDAASRSRAAFTSDTEAMPSAHLARPSTGVLLGVLTRLQRGRPALASQTCTTILVAPEEAAELTFDGAGLMDVRALARVTFGP